MNLNQFRKSLNAHNRRIEDVRSVAADNALVTGRYPVNSAGEAFFEVDFPIRFVSQPIFNPGLEMQEGVATHMGYLPTYSAYVAEWKTKEIMPTSVYFVGAKIHLVTSGQFYQKFFFTYSFTGVALSNPSA